MHCDYRAADAAARWLGTPYLTGQAVRGLGCDCVGLLRGLIAELGGGPLPEVPGWRRDWSDARGRPLMAAARRLLIEVPVEEAGPGCAVILRMHLGREAHCGVLGLPDAEGNPWILHACEGSGVVRVPLASFRPQIAFAGLFPS